MQVHIQKSTKDQLTAFIDRWSCKEQHTELLVLNSALFVCHRSFLSVANASDLQTGQTFLTSSHFFKQLAWYSCPQLSVPTFSRF